jgi:hypothetical protein
MINIPLGTNITTKVPMDIIFHNLLLDLILWCEDQGSTETNQQQPTDITQKITNANEQHELPMNLK